MASRTRENQRTLLVTDLDNTLWDWLHAWHVSFSAMLEALTAASGLPAEVLEPEIRAVHQRRGTTEYSHLLNELPSLRQRAGAQEPLTVYDEAMHALHKARKEATHLYPHVAETLRRIKQQGVEVVAYTESLAYWTEWRIKHTGLDGVIDVLYSSPDHDLPEGVSFEDLRWRSADQYGLRQTKHVHVPAGIKKPNEEILRSILVDRGRTPEQVVYVGDSLMKDIAMAQAVGVLDVHAAYGESHASGEYELLKRVTDWSDSDVARESQIASDRLVVPTTTLADFAGLLEIFSGGHAYAVN